ncbi:MAG: hypothetical protein HRT66_03615 [Flavobacteriaceae bacterium]|nr:hypothetical protein [Flavobacteriaceae bacterium]
MLQFFSHSEGYIEPANGSFEYVYQYADHLGNIRLSYKDGLSGLEIVEENNYYPFGLKHKGYNGLSTSSNTALKYKFGGKELDESLGLNLMEMDFRQYDASIGRFTAIDPVTHHSMSTYTAFDNNPVYWADPSGANSIYNFNTEQYVINGEEVTEAEAISYANEGGNADGSNNNSVNDDWVKASGSDKYTWNENINSKEDVMEEYKLDNFKREYNKNLAYCELDRKKSKEIIYLVKKELSLKEDYSMKLAWDSLKLKKIIVLDTSDLLDVIKCTGIDIEKKYDIYIVWNFDVSVDVIKYEELSKYWDDIWYDTSDEMVILYTNEFCILISECGEVRFVRMK